LSLNTLILSSPTSIWAITDRCSPRRYGRSASSVASGVINSICELVQRIPVWPLPLDGAMQLRKTS
jgi:hypothetical protein